MKAYLKTLKIHEGQFSEEKGVRIADYNGEETSGFFENDNIKNGRLEVEVLSEKGNSVLVKLSGPFEGLRSNCSFGCITVKKEDLEYVNEIRTV